MDHNNMGGLWERVERAFPEIADYIVLTPDEYQERLDDYADNRDDLEEEEVENAHYEGFEEGFDAAKAQILGYVEAMSSMDY